MGPLFPPLNEILERYLAELRRVVPDVERVILFGSHALGKANVLSDVDLAVVAPSFRGLDVISRAVRLGEANERLMLPVEAIGITPAEAKNAPPESFLAEVLRTGIPVSLGLPVPTATV